MDKTTIKLSASLEDYITAIFWIVAEKGAARGRDLAQKLKVKPASVTGALRALAEMKYINYAPYEVVTLTEEGTRQAKKVIRRHEVLRDFFVEVLQIKEHLAEEAACKMEHGIPQEIVDRLVTFTDFTKTCPRAGQSWLDQFAAHCLESSKLQCESCMQKCEDHLKMEVQKTQIQQPTVSLAQIEPGNRCMVRSIRNQATSARRLVEMGIGRGAVIEVQRVAPFGDPIEIKVKGYHLSLRQEEAKNIKVLLQ